MMVETVEFRRGEPADAEAIRALVHAAYAPWVPVIGRLPLPMQADYAQAVLRHRFDLLHVGDRLAALIETTPEGDHLLVVNVAADPAFQGRGYGVRLMALAEDLAAAADCRGLRLYTNRTYARNLRLYASLGYRVEREEPYTGAGAHADDIMVHMAKALARG